MLFNQKHHARENLTKLLEEKQLRRPKPDTFEKRAADKFDQIETQIRSEDDVSD